MDIIWSIDQLTRQSETGGVIRADWRCRASDGTYESAQIGVANFAPDPQTPGFVPFGELTEADVVGWVKTSLGDESVAEIEDRLAAETVAKAAPAELTGLPWAATPTEPATETPEA